MKSALAAVSVAVLLGASGFVAWSVLSSPGTDELSPGQAQAFNFERAGTGAPPARTPPAPEQLRDAVAEPVSPHPIPLEGMIVSGAAPAAPAAAVRSAPPPAVTPRHEAWARGTKVFAALLRAPAGFLLSGTAFKNPRALKGFLANSRAVESYMNSPLVRVALNSPAIAKSVIGSPALVRAVLASPAMRDADAVRALLGSRMMTKILDCPAIQEALSDPKVVRGILADRETLRWMSENPEALTALAKAAPALADSIGRAR